MLKSFVFITFLFISTLVSGNSIDITLDELADICEVMEDSILDVTAEYEFLVDPLPEPKSNMLAGTGPEKIKWTGAKPFSELSKFSSDESIKDISGKVWNVHISTSYNGKIAKKYQLDDMPERKVSEGTISNKENFMPRWGKTPLIYTAHHFQLIDGISLHQILREESGLIVALDNEIKKVNGFNTIRADIYTYIEGTKAHSKSIYFSPEHNFTIVKIQLYNGKQAVVAYNVLELKEVKDGIWFPVSGCITPSSPTIPKNIYKATSVVINQGLNKEYFDIEFPPGTRIFNEISGLSYVSESPDGQTGTSMNSTIQDSEVATETKIPQPPTETRKTSGTLVYVSIAAVIVLLTVLIAKKYI